MDVYIINLDRAPDRMAHMEAQMGRLGLPFIRVPAVDARQFSDDEIQAFRSSVADAYRPHAWSASQIGIFLSHMEVWSRIAAGRADVAAVFEDDVHLSARIATLLSNDDWVDRSMDIVRLETTQQSMKLSAEPLTHTRQRDIFRVHSSAWGAAGYVIRRNIAKWLEACPHRVYEPVDWFLFHPRSALAPGLKIFQLDPAPCVQDQYHPVPDQRLNFAKETLDPTSWVETLEAAGRQALSPIVRKATGRRGVRFA